MAPFCPILLRVSPEWVHGMSQSSMCDSGSWKFTTIWFLAVGLECQGSLLSDMCPGKHGDHRNFFWNIKIHSFQNRSLRGDQAASSWASVAIRNMLLLRTVCSLCLQMPGANSAPPEIAGWPPSSLNSAVCMHCHHHDVIFITSTLLYPISLSQKSKYQYRDHLAGY